jgi:hypothetical protein
MALSRRVGKAKRAHHLSAPDVFNGGHAALCPPYDFWKTA